MPLGLAPPPTADGAPSSGGTVPARQADIRTSIRPTVAEIDLGALRANARRLRHEVGAGVALYGVVKADAYGHGAVAVGRALAPLCDALAVSLAEEGLELRQAGITSPVLVLGAYYGREHSEILEANLTPVVSDPADLERFAEAPTRRRKSDPASDHQQLPVHLKIDSGMSRLGVKGGTLEDALRVLSTRPRLRLEGLCTHFACADAPDPAATHEQLRRFAEARHLVHRAGFVPRVVHAANTAATLRFPEARFGAVRPGLALYGATPSPLVPAEGLEPVLRLRTRVMGLHEVEAGTGVSYGHRFVAQRRSRIAVLPVGYADGYPRHVQSAEVLIRGQRAPVAGVVCMDMMMVDVTDVPGAGVGDEVTLIGRDAEEQIGVDDVASWAGTLNYEIVCGISKRVPRIYREGAPLAVEAHVAGALAGGPEAPSSPPEPGRG